MLTHGKGQVWVGMGVPLCRGEASFEYSEYTLKGEKLCVLFCNCCQHCTDSPMQSLFLSPTLQFHGLVFWTPSCLSAVWPWTRPLHGAFTEHIVTVDPTSSQNTTMDWHRFFRVNLNHLLVADICMWHVSPHTYGET